MRCLISALVALCVWPPLVLAGSIVNGGGGGGSGVTSIIAGTDISISPPGGTGDVTINATGVSGSGTTDTVPIWTGAAALGDSALRVVSGKFLFGANNTSSNYGTMTAEFSSGIVLGGANETGLTFRKHAGDGTIFGQGLDSSNNLYIGHTNPTLFFRAGGAVNLSVANGDLRIPVGSLKIGADAAADARLDVSVPSGNGVAAKLFAFEGGGDILQLGTIGPGGATKVQITNSGQVSVADLKTTGSASGKNVVCVDTATGQLYASSTGTDCSN
jgi:hypothetical protein